MCLYPLLPDASNGFCQIIAAFLSRTFSSSPASSIDDSNLATFFFHRNISPAILHGWRKGALPTWRRCQLIMIGTPCYKHLFLLILIGGTLFIFPSLPAFSLALQGFLTSCSFFFLTYCLSYDLGLRRATQDIWIWGLQSTQWFSYDWKGTS